MYLWVSIGLFSLFVGNVVTGSISGSPFLGDVSEMLLLALACIFFVAAILRAERIAHQGSTGGTSQ